MPLVAYHHGPRPRMKIEPAGRWRTWMEETTARSATRCLPLLVANEAGWALLNERRFTATWSGGDGVDALEVVYDGVKAQAPATSNFGHGILTFTVPYLFRTPPGWDLMVRGPANLLRDGIGPLDGLVEADWAFSTFTMNWQFTRPGSVTFEADDPFCVVLPMPRDALERFDPAVRQVEEDDPELAERWGAWRQSRHDLQVRKWLAQHTPGADPAVFMKWQSDYFRGELAEGERFPGHITKRRLKPFD